MIKTISIKVIPGARENKIIEEDAVLKIKTNKIAEDGKANDAVIELLADYFKVKKRKVRIIAGGKSRSKVVEVDLG